MTAYRDTLSPGQQARYDQAYREARAALADVSYHMAELYADGGAMAVDAAWHPGGPSREDIAASYEADVAAARAQDAAAAGSAAPRKLRTLEQIRQAGYEAAAKLPPMTPETARKVAAIIGPYLARNEAARAGEGTAARSRA